MLKITLPEGEYVELVGLGIITIEQSRNGRAKLAVQLDKRIQVVRSNAKKKTPPTSWSSGATETAADG